MLSARSIFTVVVLALASRSEASYIQNRALQPLGEQEAFLANTGVAAQGSSGAPFYNPAALTTLESHKLTAEGSVFQKASASSDAFLVIDETDLDMELAGLSPIPGSVMGSQRIWGRPVGFFVLVPDLLELRARKSWDTPDTKTALITNQVSKDLWIGGSTAFRLSDSLSLGFSLAGLQHTEVSTLVVDISYPTSANPPALTAISADFESSILGLVAGAGLLYAPSRWWSAGLRLQSPLIRLSGTGSGQILTSRLTTASGTSTLDHQFTEKTQMASNWSLPADLLAGIAIRLDEKWLLLTDLGVQRPTSYDPYPGTEFTVSVRTRAAWRGSMGVTWQASPRFRWLGGLGYNASSTLLTASGSAMGSTDTPFWILTVGLQSRLGPVTSGFGAYYQFANGQTATILAEKLSGYRERRYGALLTFSYEFDRFLPRVEATQEPVTEPF